MIFGEHSNIVESDILTMQRFVDVSRFLYMYSGGWHVCKCLISDEKLICFISDDYLVVFYPVCYKVSTIHPPDPNDCHLLAFDHMNN